MDDQLDTSWICACKIDSSKFHVADNIVNPTNLDLIVELLVIIIFCIYIYEILLLGPHFQELIR